MDTVKIRAVEKIATPEERKEERKGVEQPEVAWRLQLDPRAEKGR